MHTLTVLAEVVRPSDSTLLASAGGRKRRRLDNAAAEPARTWGCAPVWPPRLAYRRDSPSGRSWTRTRDLFLIREAL